MPGRVPSSTGFRDSQTALGTLVKLLPARCGKAFKSHQSLATSQEIILYWGSLCCMGAQVLPQTVPGAAQESFLRPQPMFSHLHHWERDCIHTAQATFCTNICPFGFKIRRFAFSTASQDWG